VVEPIEGALVFGGTAVYTDWAAELPSKLGDPVEEPLPPLCGRFWNETAHYWQQWVKQCDIPLLYQQEVIRSALALKLHCYEDTGAIIAAMTTSIPESAGRAGAPGTTGMLAA